MSRGTRDAVGWTVLTAVGLALTWLAIRSGAQLGTAGAPFLGRYRWEIGPGSLLAPAVAVVVIAVAARSWLDRAPWWTVVTLSYLSGLGWALALAFANGASGLTRALSDPDEYPADLSRIGIDPLGFVRHFTADAGHLSVATRGHPPGPALLAWVLDRVSPDRLTMGLLITALGVVTIPLVLIAVRGPCGEVAARRSLPVLVLAPYAVWVAVSLDAVAATLGAATVAVGVHASADGRTGWRSAAWAAV